MISAELALIFWLGIALALCQSKALPLSQQSIPPDTLITLRSPNCFLRCPDYLLTISADGIVMYEGFANVRLTGKAQTQISREKVQLLIAAFMKANYFSLRDKYESKEDGCKNMWADSGSVTTSIQIGGKSKTIFHYLGCHRKGLTPYPKALSELERKIDEVADSKQWID